MAIIVSTPRFTVRSFKAEEEAAFIAMSTDERVTTYLPKRTLEEHITIFRNNLLEPQGALTGRWGIFNNTDDDMIGNCLLRPFDDGSDRVELGYVLNHKYWGMGIASEMARGLLSHASGIDPNVKLVAVTDIDNKASQHVLLKLGMLQGENYFRHNEELAFFAMP
ncbi:MAG: GNAT family N-acetyltransferase [Mucilaginibacter sp.]